MSSDWTETNIGEFSPFTYGKGLKKDDRDNTGNVLVYGSNGPVDTHTEGLIDQPGIIIGRKGSVGEVHLSDGPFWPIDTAFYTIKDDLEELWFTYYLLLSVGLDQMNSDSAVPGLNRDRAHSVIITIPKSVDQRKKIGRDLRLFDQKIHLNKQMNETLEGMAQAIFKSWFVDFDPVHAKIKAKAVGHDPNQAAMAAIAGVSLGQDWDDIEAALQQKLDRMSDEQRTQLHQTAELFPDELVDREIGEIPKGWGIDSVFNQSEYINGAAFRGEDFTNNKSGLPIIKIAEMKSGISDQTKFTEKEVDKKYHIDDGDILFSWSGNPDTSIGIFIWQGGKGLLNQHIFKVENKNKNRKIFSYFFLNSMLPFFKRTAANKQTTGLGHVTQRDLKRKQISVPSKELIKVFSKTADPIFDKVFSNLMEIQNLNKLRDTLLPKLISGEIEV